MWECKYPPSPNYTRSSRTSCVLAERKLILSENFELCARMLLQPWGDDNHFRFGLLLPRLACTPSTSLQILSVSLGVDTHAVCIANFNNLRGSEAVVLAGRSLAVAISASAARCVLGAWLTSRESFVLHAQLRRMGIRDHQPSTKIEKRNVKRNAAFQRRERRITIECT